MNFIKYQHIEKFGTDETEGIEIGTCYVFSKIDGSCSSLWVDDEFKLCAGSRSRQLSVEKDNAGFYSQMLKDKKINSFFKSYPMYSLYGEWLCLSGDTIIKKVSGGRGTKGNFMTIREMYDYYHTDIYEKNHYQTKKEKKEIVTKRPSWWKRYGLPSIYSLYIDKDLVLPNKIKNIVKTRIKKCYKITVRRGFSIKCSLDHPLFTNLGWKPIKDLKVNDVVGISDLWHIKDKRRLGKGYSKITKQIKNFKTLPENKKCILCGAIEKLELDHIDENWKNNDINNYQILCRSCHCKKSANNKKTKANSKGYSYEFDKIVSIEYLGEEEMFDIEMEGTENETNFVANNFIVHNCPHSLKTYRDEAWRKFYVFDVCYYNKEKEKLEYLTYEQYQPVLEQYEIDYIPCMAKITNPDYETLIKKLGQNNYLIKDGEGIGEGIVIKNYDFENKYGRQTWAKIVSSEFKEKHFRVMGPAESKGKDSLEEKIIEQYCTEALIDKVFAKIKNECEGWSSKYIPRLLNTVFHDLVNEEIWNIIKEYKNPKIDFKILHIYMTYKIKRLRENIF